MRALFIYSFDSVKKPLKLKSPVLMSPKQSDIDIPRELVKPLSLNNQKYKYKALTPNGSSTREDDSSFTALEKFVTD